MDSSLLNEQIIKDNFFKLIKSGPEDAANYFFQLLMERDELLILNQDLKNDLNNMKSDFSVLEMKYNQLKKEKSSITNDLNLLEIQSTEIQEKQLNENIKLINLVKELNKKINLKNDQIIELENDQHLKETNDNNFINNKQTNKFTNLKEKIDDLNKKIIELKKINIFLGVKVKLADNYNLDLKNKIRTINYILMIENLNQFNDVSNFVNNNSDYNNFLTNYVFK